MLALAVVCIAVNFNIAFMGDTPQPINITATVFYLLFWALILRLQPAAKTSSWLALYSMVASIVGFCAIFGDWSGFGRTIATVLVFPVSSLFYGIKFVSNFSVFYFIVAMISFVLLICSLITVANPKVPQPKQKKDKQKQPEEKSAATPLVPETVEAEIVQAEVVTPPQQEAPLQPELLPQPQNEEYDDVTARTNYETDSKE